MVLWQLVLLSLPPQHQHLQPVVVTRLWVGQRERCRFRPRPPLPRAMHFASQDRQRHATHPTNPPPPATPPTQPTTLTSSPSPGAAGWRGGRAWGRVTSARRDVGRGVRHGEGNWAHARGSGVRVYVRDLQCLKCGGRGAACRRGEEKYARVSVLCLFSPRDARHSLNLRPLLCHGSAAAPGPATHLSTPLPCRGGHYSPPLPFPPPPTPNHSYALPPPPQHAPPAARRAPRRRRRQHGRQVPGEWSGVKSYIGPKTQGETRDRFFLQLEGDGHALTLALAFRPPTTTPHPQSVTCCAPPSTRPGRSCPR